MLILKLQNLWNGKYHYLGSHEQDIFFQAIFGKVYVLGWWDMEIIQTDTGTQFASKEFQEVISIRGVRLALAEPDHPEMHGQVEITC